jgi:serine/threonine protein kinase
VKPTSNPIDPVTDTRFELVLGQGASGAVYLALDRDTGEQVALKKLLGDQAQAIALMQSCWKLIEARNIRQGREYDRYTLGLLLGDRQGAQLMAAARAGLLESGIADPAANMRAYVPELMR